MSIVFLGTNCVIHRKCGFYADAGFLIKAGLQNGFLKLAGRGIHDPEMGLAGATFPLLFDVQDSADSGDTCEIRQLGACLWNCSFQLSAISYQLSAFSTQLSAFSAQPTAFSGQLSAFNDQLSAFSFQRSAFSFQRSALSHQV